MHSSAHSSIIYNSQQIEATSVFFKRHINREYVVCMCICVLCHSAVSDFGDPMDCSPPGSSVHGIFHSRILEWFAISSSRRSPHQGVEPTSLALAGEFFTTVSPEKPHLCVYVCVCVSYAQWNISHPYSKKIHIL